MITLSITSLWLFRLTYLIMGLFISTIVLFYKGFEKPAGPAIIGFFCVWALLWPLFVGFCLIVIVHSILVRLGIIDDPKR